MNKHMWEFRKSESNYCNLNFVLKETMCVLVTQSCLTLWPHEL